MTPTFITPEQFASLTNKLDSIIEIQNEQQLQLELIRDRIESIDSSGSGFGIEDLDEFDV